MEAVAIGTFEPTGKLKFFYHGQQVADLDMHFLHDGRPDVFESQMVWPLFRPLPSG
ncbi:MAG: hypothetical protein U0744_09815 [Gemmataceae bacterium]